MSFRTSFLAVAALAAATVTSPLPATAEETALAGTVRLMQRLATQYAVLTTRMFVDLTYDSIVIEPGTNDLILTGLRLHPELGHGGDAPCEIAIDRVVVADANRLDTLRMTVEISGLAVPPACLDPETALMLAGFGYGGLTADTMAIDLAYDLPSSAADLVVQASVVDAAEVALTAHFDYVFLRFPLEDAADADTVAAGPVPVARLGSAELVIENRGLWEALEPVMTEQMGDPGMLPQMVQMGLGDLFTEGGTRAPTPEEAAFVDSLAAEIGRFIASRDRIVITAAPENGSVALTTDTVASPGALVAALRPMVSATPRAFREMVAPADLAAALAGDAAPDPETRLDIGRALITGIGAPRSVEAGRTLLVPLAEAWNAPAALLTGQAAQAAGDQEDAYAMALRAMAGDAPGAIALADDLEPALPLTALLAAQDEAMAGWPGAAEAEASAGRLLSDGDVPGMRQRAYAAATGRGRPRSYGEAYYWASLAGAAGDRAAASLRQRLDDRFREQDGWRPVAEARAAAALDTWMGGLGQTIADRMR